MSLSTQRNAVPVHIPLYIGDVGMIQNFRDAADKYSSGAFGGSISGTNTISGCFRNAGLQFTDPFRTIQTHADLAAGTPEGAANQNAYDSTPSAEKTLTDAAKKAGWSSDIWNFSDAVPVLKK